MVSGAPRGPLPPEGFRRGGEHRFDAVEDDGCESTLRLQRERFVAVVRDERRDVGRHFEARPWLRDVVGDDEVDSLGLQFFSRTRRRVARLRRKADENGARAVAPARAELGEDVASAHEPEGHPLVVFCEFGGSRAVLWRVIRHRG